MTIDNIEVEVLLVKERAKFLGQTIRFEQQETTGIQESNQRSLDINYQEETGANIEIVPTTTQTSLTADMCLWNMDPLE